MSDAQQSLTGKLSGLAGRMFPGLEERAYRRSRDQVIDSLTTAGNYGTRLSDLAMSFGAAARPSHVVIVPMQGPIFDTWKPAGGNFFTRSRSRHVSTRVPTRFRFSRCARKSRPPTGMSD